MPPIISPNSDLFLVEFMAQINGEFIFLLYNYLKKLFYYLFVFSLFERFLTKINVILVQNKLVFHGLKFFVRIG